MAIEYRSAEGLNDQLPALALELARRQVAVIASPVGTPSTLAAKAATSTIPIVFGVNEDPVKLGLVATLARPGGNATGINILTGELVAKRLELLRELVPGAARVAVLVNPTNAANTETTLRDVEGAARAIGLQIQVLNASTGRQINAAFAAFARERPDALFVGADPFFTSRQEVEAGGLMSYGPNFSGLYRRAGDYVDKILRGATPADLPIEQPTEFDLVINLITAKALDLTVPPTLLAQADEVIE